MYHETFLLVGVMGRFSFIYFFQVWAAFSNEDIYIFFCFGEALSEGFFGLKGKLTLPIAEMPLWMLMIREVYNLNAHARIPKLTSTISHKARIRGGPERWVALAWLNLVALLTTYYLILKKII